MNTYQLLKDVCGISSIVCQASMLSDLSYYEGWHLNNEDCQHMLNDYNLYYNKLWTYINHNKNNEASTELGDNNQTPLEQMEDGLYYGVVKIDFKRAFTNYTERVFDQAFVKILKSFYMDIAKLYLPKSAKKFLYNYTCTNLTIHLLGKDALGNLRKAVYDDVLYVSKYMGPIIKAEVDGAYILTKIKQPIVDDVFGTITVKPFKWLLMQNNMLIGRLENGNVVVKGLGKRKPNRLNAMLVEMVEGNNADRDNAIDKFLYNLQTHVLDWAYKTEDGQKVRLLINNMNIEVDAATNEDIMDINNLLPQLNRDSYLEDVYDIASSIFELVG